MSGEPIESFVDHPAIGPLWERAQLEYPLLDLGEFHIACGAALLAIAMQRGGSFDGKVNLRQLWRALAKVLPNLPSCTKPKKSELH
jgi:hypothetical protein